MPGKVMRSVLVSGYIWTTSWAACLLGAQRDHRIHSQRAAHRIPAGDEGHGDEEEEHASERRRIGWTDSIEDVAEKACGAQGENEAETLADQDHCHGLSRDQPEQVALLRAERHSNPDLVSSAANDVGHDAVES